LEKGGILRKKEMDFIGNYSSVVDDSSFRVILTMIKKLGFKVWSIDIETAFLNGKLEEEIYMRIPKGYNSKDAEFNSNSMALKLNKSIYGLVQAAMQWHTRFEEEIIKLGFERNEINPCLLFKQKGAKICILCIYADDAIVTGNEELMEMTINGIQKVFKVKVQKSIEDFLGCEIEENSKGMMLTQKRIVGKLIKDNNNKVIADDKFLKLLLHLDSSSFVQIRKKWKW
jgi:Reverse transcriptase (RNA-dependent DNA polymerase)